MSERQWRFQWVGLALVVVLGWIFASFLGGLRFFIAGIDVTAFIGSFVFLLFVGVGLLGAGTILMMDYYDAGDEDSTIGDPNQLPVSEAAQKASVN